MLKRLYHRTLELSAHPHAIWWLAALSFAESSFFPIPPDVMIIPMVLAARSRWFQVAFVCTIASVAGALAGYYIGWGLFESVGQPMLEMVPGASMEKFEGAKALYQEWGLWIVFTAGFSPIPYKIFTIASGVMEMNLIGFVLASLIGRGARFFLVAWLLYRYGAPIRAFIEKRLGLVTLVGCLVLVGLYVIIKQLH